VHIRSASPLGLGKTGISQVINILFSEFDVTEDSGLEELLVVGLSLIE
jgi:hypothetical protein